MGFTSIHGGNWSKRLECPKLPEELSSEEYRSRLNKVLQCLHDFSLPVKDFALHELIRQPALPTQDQIEQRLAQDNALEGYPFSPRYIATAIINLLKQSAPLSSPDEDACAKADAYKVVLSGVPAGETHAKQYQNVVFDILEFLFGDALVEGEKEVRTVDGTERRDIVYTNASPTSFWTSVRQEHSSMFIMFEIKNETRIAAPAFNQTATYLGDRLGRLGFIVTRNPLTGSQKKKSYSIYNDSTPKKIILVLADEDLRNMLDTKCEGNQPTNYIQKLYRNFRTSVQ